MQNFPMPRRGPQSPAPRACSVGLSKIAATLVDAHSKRHQDAGRAMHQLVLGLVDHNNRRVLTPSLFQFLCQVSRDPEVREVMVVWHEGQYHAGMMNAAASYAQTNNEIREHERDAFHAATLIARVGKMIERSARQVVPSPVCAHRLHARWRRTLKSAITALHEVDPVNAAIVAAVLGIEGPVNLDAENTARLQAVVNLAWVRACASQPDYLK